MVGIATVSRANVVSAVAFHKVKTYIYIYSL